MAEIIGLPAAARWPKRRRYRKGGIASVAADYLLVSRPGLRAELATLQAVARGELQMEGLTVADLQRCIELVEQYGGRDIGFVDASIVAVAERLRVTRILTLDQRHARLLNPKHCAAFDLVP